jgi:hypothetical protein
MSLACRLPLCVDVESLNMSKNTMETRACCKIKMRRVGASGEMKG